MSTEEEKDSFGEIRWQETCGDITLEAPSETMYVTKTGLSLEDYILAFITVCLGSLMFGAIIALII